MLCLTTKSGIKPVIMSQAIRKAEPFVVIAGWLGSQPKQLCRYKELYRQAGFRVLSRIACPPMVVNSVFLTSVDINPPARWPLCDNTALTKSSYMQDLAWEVLSQLHFSQSQDVMFHLFSNGGCFFWEQISRILSSSLQDEIDGKETLTNFSNDLQNIQSRIRGAVFDSCPSTDLSRLKDAVAYCSDEELDEINQECGSDILSAGDEIMKRNFGERGSDYINFLKTDPWPIPQLYIYSKDDPLSPSQVIDELVQSRQGMLGKDIIFSKRWESSAHVSHLRIHPEEYRAVLESFISVCIKSPTTSKL